MGTNWAQLFKGRLALLTQGLVLLLGLFFFCSKVFSSIIFSILFRASSLQIVHKKIKLFCFLSFISEFKFHPSLNNCKTLRTPHMWDCTWGGGGSQAIERIG